VFLNQYATASRGPCASHIRGDRVMARLISPCSLSLCRCHPHARNSYIGAALPGSQSPREAAHAHGAPSYRAPAARRKTIRLDTHDRKIMTRRIVLNYHGLFNISGTTCCCPSRRLQCGTRWKRRHFRRARFESVYFVIPRLNVSKVLQHWCRVQIRCTQRIHHP
jgi:hypothetical protein